MPIPIPDADAVAMHPETLMMGHGYRPDWSEGSLKPPIFLTSTFVFLKAEDGKRFFEGITGKRPGGRVACSTTDHRSATDR